MRIGIVCPYSFDVPGGVQFHVRDLAEHLIGRGHEVSVLAPADDDTPVPPLRRPGRPRGPGALQRLGGPGDLRPGHRGPGAPVARRGRLRRPAHPRAGHAVPVAAGAVGGRRARSSRPSTPRTCARGPCRRPTRCCGRAWRRSRRGSRSPRTPAGPGHDHLGGDAVVIPNGVYVDRFAARRPEPGVAGTPDRADRRASSAGSTSRARACRCSSRRCPRCCERYPGPRVLVAGRG